MTTLITKTISLFCHEWQRVRVSTRHLISAGRASISILTIIIVVRAIVVLGCLKCLKRRKGRLHKVTKASLPSGNTVDTGVHLIQLSRECIKTSIHTEAAPWSHLESHLPQKKRERRWMELKEWEELSSVSGSASSEVVQNSTLR